METVETLDVTRIEPRLKHPSIFKKFDSLPAENSFIISNDHDPMPLYYQMLAERGNTFTWEYIEKGPLTWKVKISKLGGILPEPTIGELVAEDYRKAEIFKKYGIDFCCGGKKTLSKACEEKGINVLHIQEDLKQAGQHHSVPSEDFNSFDAGFLSEYILNTHHRYVKNAIPLISDFVNKVARVHGDRHPEAVGIAKIWGDVVQELSGHMMKEENILFPYIMHLSDAKKKGIPADFPPFGTVANPIRAMEHEHDVVGDLMKRINKLSSGYTIPEDSCTTFRLSYLKLHEFEEDLHRHIHLENNILFPKAVELERELVK